MEEDEGIVMTKEDMMGNINTSHTVTTIDEGVMEEMSPVLQDCRMDPHLHLPRFEEAEDLALTLSELADTTGKHIIPPIPPEQRQTICKAANLLHDHDKVSSRFVKEYESRWGQTLFGRCLGPESSVSSGAQKTKFARFQYAQAVQISEESRVLYLLIKILKNRPPAAARWVRQPRLLVQFWEIIGGSQIVSVMILFSKLSIPLPNINTKSITSFISKQQKKANYSATTIPKAQPHNRDRLIYSLWSGRIQTPHIDYYDSSFCFDLAIPSDLPVLTLLQHAIYYTEISSIVHYLGIWQVLVTD